MSEDRIAILSNPARLRAADPGGMLERLAAFPGEFAAAIAEPPPPLAPPARILVGGMGGSAIAGDLAAGLLAEAGGGDLRVVRGYRLPPTRQGDLVILCSYSGNTEETLSLEAQASERGVQRLAMSSGGELSARSCRDMPLIRIPGGSPPRAALPSLLGRLLGLLAGWGGDWHPGDGMGEAVAELRETAAACAPERLPKDDEAKLMALALGDESPVFVSLGESSAAVGLRLRCQMEENAKRLALSRELPELHHNSWVPWMEGTVGGIPVWLGEAAAHERVRIRARLSAKKLREMGSASFYLPGRGDSALSQVLTSVLLGDYLTVYHALMRGVDPTPVGAIEILKRDLAAWAEKSPHEEEA